MLEVLNLLIDEIFCFFQEPLMVFFLSVIGVVILVFQAVGFMFLCYGLLMDLFDGRKENNADEK